MVKLINKVTNEMKVKHYQKDEAYKNDFVRPNDNLQRWTHEMVTTVKQLHRQKKMPKKEPHRKTSI